MAKGFCFVGEKEVEKRSRLKDEAQDGVEENGLVIEFFFVLFKFFKAASVTLLLKSKEIANDNIDRAAGENCYCVGIEEGHERAKCPYGSHQENDPWDLR